ncbi:MAG: 4Fe-4S dicluster domain-containing protein [Acidobacteriia bacterium]|nr:4Fe-4S dicluster domain-containing protein [Terriglobia bacterium]
MDLKRIKEDTWMIALLALVVCAAFLLGGLARAIFIALSVGSIWLFFRTVNRRLFSVFPKHGDLPHDHIPKRLWRVFVEVILQYRVVRDRPVVGILHAAVLWGFFAFAWASAEHLQWGLRGLEKATEARTWYGTFVATWALAVLVAMIGLSFRRFVLRPKLLGKLSATSGIVAFLISALMATYLLGWRVLPIGSVAWKVNWWMHTSAFLLLLVVIPISKHLHLVLAPVTIFLRSETTSPMRALRVEGDDLGMIHFKDLGRKDVLDVDACVECGRCTQFCPANLAGGSLSPKEIILDMRKGLLSGGDIVTRTAAEKEQGKAFISEEDLFQCFSCGACEYVCPVGVEHVGRKILDLRRGLVSEGRITNDKVNQLFTTMERAPHNPWGIAHDTRQKLIESRQFPTFDGTQEWLFWLGCGLSFDQHGQAVAQAMKQILDFAGVSWGVLPRETCCGEPARRAGNEYLFLELSEKLIETFETARVKKLVSCCPHCTTMLDKDYRQIASYAKLHVGVMHHTELIAELLPRLPIKPSVVRATYHDPCYLARGRAITAAPRKILRSCGISVTEAAHHGQNTQCCGAGGAQLFVADDQRGQGQARVNELRFAELVETKTSTVVVACPYCPIMLRDAANHIQRDDVEIVDLAEIVAKTLQPKPDAELFLNSAALRVVPEKKQQT